MGNTQEMYILDSSKTDMTQLKILLYAAEADRLKDLCKATDGWLEVCNVGFMLSEVMKLTQRSNVDKMKEEQETHGYTYLRNEDGVSSHWFLKLIKVEETRAHGARAAYCSIELDERGN